MSNGKIDTVRSSSSGTPGRAVSQARGQRLVLDSSSHPHLDAFTNSEAFLAGISSCGVTLIEVYAQDKGVPVKRMEVSIEGLRTAERLCDAFGWHPRELYGDAYDRAALAGCPPDYDPWHGVA